MSDLTTTFAALSDVGRARRNNEDAFQITDLSTGTSFGASPSSGKFAVRERGALFALSDGLGGHPGGEVASAVVIAALRNALQTDVRGQTEERLEAAIRAANAEVTAAGVTQNKPGMGATLTAVLVDDSEAYIAEVGDSRAYLLRGGRLKQLTHDQSVVQMMLDTGIYTKEEAEQSSQKNLLLQAMGTTSDVHAAIGRVLLRRGDKMLLCSDGISNAADDDELREILQGHDPSAACARLISLANDRGGADNATAVVALFEDGNLAAPFPSETVTATFAVLKDFAAPLFGRP